MKAMYRLVRICETGFKIRNGTLGWELCRAVDEARADLIAIETKLEHAKSDPDDTVGRLHALADELHRNGVPADRTQILIDAAEEIMYLRQWPGVIAECDKREADLRRRLSRAAIGIFE